ncbi:sensor histidine kinase [Sediminivirga luteola]|uniref:Two-component sensor histidine kinase n=1 Tax=Sediminivirga luteola TaxID=1774748 RepID=A0A8J2XLL9_9MICO|nr:histidine kinase [Sediminivirga luteola]GGA23884.1 two-component sensor histidine kinase [Sediminivirga luteola]
MGHASAPGRDELKETGKATQRHLAARHIAGFVYAGIWAVFLVVPAIGTAYSDAALPWKVLAWTATAVFTAGYLALAWRWFSDEAEDPMLAGQGAVPSQRELVTGVLVLAAVAVLAIPGAGAYVSAFAPYLSALIIFTRPPRLGVPLGLLIWAVPSTLAYLLDGGGVLWIVLGPGIGFAFIVIIRLTEYYDTRDRQRAEELRHAAERDAIARDVHDVLGHSLTVLSIKAQLAARLLDSDPARARDELTQIDALARESLGQIRSTVSRLRTPELRGELDAARSALEAAGIDAEITVGTDTAAHARIGTALGRGAGTRTGTGSVDAGDLRDPGGLLAWALREAVTNVLRHSGAGRCRIQLAPGLLRVADDGTGMTGQEGNGLRGLRERARAAGATVRLTPAHPHMEGTSPQRPGTLIEVRKS